MTSDEENDESLLDGEEKELFDSVMDSVQLDIKYSTANGNDKEVSDSDILARLAKLKEGMPVSNSIKTTTTSTIAVTKTPSPPVEDDDPPLCSLCDLDAKLQCIHEDCEGDVFCNRCWKETHLGPAAFDETYRSHKNRPIKK